MPGEFSSGILVFRKEMKMEQNFRVVVCDGKKLMRIDPADFGVSVRLGVPNGIGPGNRLANAVYILLSQKPQRVCWMGSLADEPYQPGIDLYADALPEEEFMEYYETAWGRVSAGRIILPKQFSPDMLQFAVQMKTKGAYLINHSRMVYLDMGNYIGFNRTGDSCPDPLSLLTTCGNGRGDREYPPSAPGADQIGTWAFDLLSYTDRKPDENYREARPCFKEKQSTVLGSLAGKTVVVTGTVPNYTRSEVEFMIQQAGGKMGSSVTHSTDYLVVAEKPGATKLNRAADLGIPQITASDLMAMLD